MRTEDLMHPGFSRCKLWLPSEVVVLYTGITITFSKEFLGSVARVLAFGLPRRSGLWDGVRAGRGVGRYLIAFTGPSSPRPRSAMATYVRGTKLPGFLQS